MQQPIVRSCISEHLIEITVLKKSHSSISSVANTRVCKCICMLLSLEIIGCVNAL